MNYDTLELSYKKMQSKRIAEEYNKINQRATKTTQEGSTSLAEDGLALGEGRRLKAAILFLDISSFTLRHLETEQEQNAMLRAFNLFFSEMIKIAEDYGGIVEKNTGDGLLAYFEDENGCKRAMACAQTMFVTNETLINPIFEANHIQPFIFRVAMSYGFVTIARIGAQDYFNQYVAIGSEANFAAKMLAKALPNEIIISEAVKNALPIDWQTRFITVVTNSDGTVYNDPIIPYALYKFTARWN